MTATTNGRPGGRPDGDTTVVQRLRTRHRSLDHLLRAGVRYTQHHGDHYAAAVTFFSVLSLVPLLMIGVAIAGYVLHLDPALLGEVRRAITSAAPPGLAGPINEIIDQAVAQRNVVAGVGLLAALYSGIGWTSNLRDALSEQWAQPPDPPALPRRLLVDLAALLGLGAALLVTFVVTGLASDALAFLGVGGWGMVLPRVLGVLLALATDFLVFLWVITRLPRRHVALRGAVRAALLGAVGFEVLKQVMTVYLGLVTGSPSGAVFGSTLGLLIFIFFASRWVLFVTAWAATGRQEEQEPVVPVPAPAVIRSEVVVRSGPDGRTTAGLLGAGAVAGVLGMRALHRDRT